MSQFRVIFGDCREQVLEQPADAIVCDPPYHLTTGKKGGTGAASNNPNSPAGRSRIGTGFMGKAWDGGDVAFRPETWAHLLGQVKPGAHLLAFGGPRTFHRVACAIEDGGWELRDTISWVYGSGFPKSLDVSKAIDKAAGQERQVLREGKPVKRMIPGADQNATGSWAKDNGREFVPTETAPATPEAEQWQGWGTALKPAWEPIIVARKPLVGTVAQNILAHGTGAINVGACRVGADGGPDGRWPANLIHDGSDEVLALFPDAPGQQCALTGQEPSGKMGSANCYGRMDRRHAVEPRLEIETSAARFFYCAKADQTDRGDGNTHPTVKPNALMRYLCRLVTPPGGLVYDPFTGSGSTGVAALQGGFQFVGCELIASHVEIAKRRLVDVRQPGLAL